MTYSAELHARRSEASVSLFDVHASEFLVMDAGVPTQPDLTLVTSVTWEAVGPFNTTRATWHAVILSQAADVLRVAREHRRHDFWVEGHYDVRAVLEHPAGRLYGKWHVLRVSA